MSLRSDRKKLTLFPSGESRVLHKKNMKEVGMVSNSRSQLDEAEKRAEERTTALIHEFHEHYQEYVEAHPAHAEKKHEVFEAWAIQKIAGLQLCIEHLAEQHNLHIAGKKSPDNS